ncbi:thioesterase family protein [Mesobacillus subterraneus]|uniref:Thioesterase n=1 Tax=Mesobacillus subterraneus TaxID=285983 RepID=A0A3R9FBQ0_9BACI|nr:thioesterase [Mesobacillus subterraneus]RSD21123.1 thioesterase [Mesobacillus subterraneus]
MRDGLKAGHTASIDVIVTPDMFARFEGKLVHPVYSTVSMVYHMEWVSRQIILPYLEDHEEGMGGAVTVKHIAPCIEGAEVKVTATVTDLQGNTVITNVRAESCGRLIGVGEVKQVILPKTKITELLTGR